MLHFSKYPFKSTIVLTLFYLLSFSVLVAQEKKIKVKFVFHTGVNVNDFRIFYDNGIKSDEWIIPKNNSINEWIVETECFIPYLKVMLPGIYKDDQFENQEELYVEKEFAQIDFYENLNKEDNLKYQYKLTGVSIDVGNLNYKKSIKKDIDELLQLRKADNFYENDSLRKLYKEKSLKLQWKEFNLIKENSSQFFYQDLFLNKIPIFHYTKNKTELLNFFSANFDEAFRKTIYGQRILNKILELELEENSLAPNILQRSLKGSIVDLSNYKDKYVLINFWATWCKPCIKEMPILKEIADKYEEKGLKMILISSDSNRAILEKFIKNNKMDWVHIQDKDNIINDTWRVDSIPKTFLVNKGGRIIYSTNFSNDNESLEKLKNLLEKL